MLNAVSRFFLLSFNFKKTAPVGIFQKALWKNLQPVILLSMLSGLLLYCAPSSHFSRSILNTRGKVKFYVFHYSYLCFSQLLCFKSKFYFFIPGSCFAKKKPIKYCLFFLRELIKERYPQENKNTASLRVFYTKQIKLI